MTDKITHPQRAYRPVLLWLAIAAMLLTGSTQGFAAANQQTILSLEASQAATEGRYSDAIGIYNQLITLAPQQASYYIQRGLLYRQIKQSARSQADGKTALDLATQKLAQKSDGRGAAKYYWQRAQAYRLLEQYKPALADIRYAMRLKPNNRWLPDLQAIELESKIYNPGL